MSGNDLVVAAVIVILVIAAVGYLAYQRRKGVSSCGCKTCTHCKPKSNVTIDEGESRCECCKKK